MRESRATVSANEPTAAARAVQPNSIIVYLQRWQGLMLTYYGVMGTNYPVCTGCCGNAPHPSSVLKYPNYSLPVPPEAHGADMLVVLPRRTRHSVLVRADTEGREQNHDCTQDPR